VSTTGKLLKYVYIELIESIRIHFFQIGWKYVSNFQNELKHIIFLKDK